MARREDGRRDYLRMRAKRPQSFQCRDASIVPSPGFMVLWGLAEMNVDWQGIACPDGGSLCQVKVLVEGKLDVLQASACVWAAAEQRL